MFQCFQKSIFDPNTCTLPKSPNNGFRWFPLGKLSHLGLEQLLWDLQISMTLCGFLDHIGIKIYSDAVTNMFPSQGCMKYTLKEKGFLYLNLMRNIMRKIKYQYGGFNRWNSRKGGTVFVKFVAWIQRGEFGKKVNKLVLYIEGGEGMSKNASILPILLSHPAYQVNGKGF